MSPLTLSEIAAILGGTLLGSGGNVSVANISTDSRTIQPGDLFIALRGDTHDGHDRLNEVAAKGAAAAIVARAPSPEQAAARFPLVDVADTRVALGQLANHARRQLTQTKVLAVAGSNGKTTTKNLLHAVLSTRLNGSASPKSFNNDIGVPATLLPVDPADDYVIVEIGTNHPGEIENLSRIAEPDLAIITSIGEEHLEFFHDLAGVRHENAQITAGLRSGAPLIVTGDDPGLRSVLNGNPTMRTFGFEAANDLRAMNVAVAAAGTSFDFAARRWHVPLIGAHFAACGLAVIACARWLGLSDDDIQRGFDRAEASDMRMQPRQCGAVTLLNDAYNANPTSMRAALDTAAALLKKSIPARRLVLVLGEMGELGAASPAAHQSIADAARQMRAVVVTVGERFKSLANPSHWFSDSAAAAAAIVPMIQPGDYVLLKGSRSVKLECVAEAIATAAANGALGEALA